MAVPTPVKSTRQDISGRGKKRVDDGEGSETGQGNKTRIS